VLGVLLYWGVRVIGDFISLNTSWDLKNISLWIGDFVAVLGDFLGCVGGFFGLCWGIFWVVLGC
jgi:hypothetical protein